MLSWARHCILKAPTDEEQLLMEPADLLAYWKNYHDVIKRAEDDPYRHGFVLENWRRMKDCFTQVNEVLALGGNRCLAGEQEIYDPVQKKKLRVDQITEPFHVYAYDEASKSYVITKAEVPFQKPHQSLFQLSLSNGRTLSCSATHRVLTTLGWKEVGELRPQDRILGINEDILEESLPPSCGRNPLSSTLGTCQSVCEKGVQRSTQKAQDSQCDCHCECRSCGEQPRSAVNNDPNAFPLQGDALAHSDPYGTNFQPLSLYVEYSTGRKLGDQVSKSQYTPVCLCDDHQPTQDDLQLPVAQFVDTQSSASCKPCKLTSLSREDQETWLNHWQSDAGCDQKQCVSESRLSDKELSHILAYGGNSAEAVEVVNSYFLRKDVVWDFTVPKYHNYVAGGVVNHNSSKTSGGAWLVVNSAMANPKSLIICFSQNAELSVLVQQAAIYKALPQELRQKTLGSNEYISFTSQNGFAGSGFILPNGSRILFKTYSQFSQNNTVLEGMELGSYEPTSVNLGAWCDEYLGGPELINTLVFRLATRNAKMLLTFTPIDGYTQTVREYLDGAKTLEWKKAEALNNIDVPYVQRAKDKDAAIIYFHTKDNPFSGYERVLKEAKAKDDEWIKTRLYGIPTKSITSLFPRFDVKVNVVKHDTIPTKGVTRYLIIDPAGRKNWFMAWIAVDESGCWWVYREWPDINVGEWGKWRGNKWTAGEGCKSLGMGIKDYVDLINNSEVGETIFERIIDPRLGQAKYSHERGQSSIIEDLADNGVICHPAPGLHEDDGLQALQSKMAWINTKPLDAINRPHFYVSERCENIIWSLQEYTGAQGPDEQAKDCVDCLRYAAVSDIYYVDPKDFKNVKRRSGGY